MSDQEHMRVPLRPILMPRARHIISAPPVLIASTNTVDYICGDCGTVLMDQSRDKSTISSSIAGHADRTIRPMHKTKTDPAQVYQAHGSCEEAAKSVTESP